MDTKKLSREELFTKINENLKEKPIDQYLFIKINDLYAENNDDSLEFMEHYLKTKKILNEMVISWKISIQEDETIPYILSSIYNEFWWKEEFIKIFDNVTSALKFNQLKKSFTIKFFKENKLWVPNDIYESISEFLVINSNKKILIEYIEKSQNKNLEKFFNDCLEKYQKNDFVYYNLWLDSLIKDWNDIKEEKLWDPKNIKEIMKKYHFFINSTWLTHSWLRESGLVVNPNKLWLTDDEIEIKINEFLENNLADSDIIFTILDLLDFIPSDSKEHEKIELNTISKLILKIASDDIKFDKENETNKNLSNIYNKFWWESEFLKIFNKSMGTEFCKSVERAKKPEIKIIRPWLNEKELEDQRSIMTIFYNKTALIDSFKEDKEKRREMYDFLVQSYINFIKEDFYKNLKYLHECKIS